MDNFLRTLRINSSKLGIEALIMFLGSIASAFAGFLGIRLLTHAYKSSEYGVGWLFLNAVSLLVLLTSGRISQTASRYYHEALYGGWFDALNRYIRLYLTRIGLVSVLVLLLFLFAGTLLDLSFVYLLSGVAAVLLYFSSSIISITLSLLNVSRKRLQRMMLSVSEAWAKPILAVFLAYVFHPNLISFVFGYTIPVIVLGALSITTIRSFSRESVGSIKTLEDKKTRLDEYAATWIWISLATWSLALLDRFIVGQMLGAAAAGKYVAAYQVGSAFFQLTGGVYGPLVQPLVFGSATKSIDNCSSLMSRSYSIFTMITLPLLFFFLCVHKELFQLLTSHDYREGIAAVPWIGVGGALWIYANLSMDIYHLKNKNNVLRNLLFIAVAANVVLTVLLVKLIGLHGAGVASGMTYLIYALLLISYSRNIMMWSFPVKTLIIASVTSLIALAAGLAIRNLFPLTSPIAYISAVGVVFALTVFTSAVLMRNFAILPKGANAE